MRATDVAVVKGTIRDYGKAHPTEALLVVEVSHESLRYDRSVTHRAAGDKVAPLARPDAQIVVDDLLP